ncbi:39S ribosomal protein L54, mitochondrial [Pristis pectinata]|uniref:39S ribosomal protein L54, mitochondrial n=1 Tax=Pristis pectinata TaxID=685728 RepID=UPI00223E3406|nr:39S ribosomal protein L54, mitochondrial [Pristis pectinata]
MAARSGWLLGRSAVSSALLRSGGVRRVAASGYAKKAAVKGRGKIGIKEALQGPEVCKDPVTLTTHAVGVNIYKQGTDPELLPDTEYPEWLFSLNLGPPKNLDELDPESWEYWKRIRKQHMWQHNKEHNGKKF